MKDTLFKAPSGASIGFTQLGLGTAPLGNLYRAVSEQQAEDTLEAAWAAGIRYYDTAPLYGLGLAETRLNHFLRGKPRQSYVVSTKVGRLLARLPAGGAHRHRQILRYAVAARGLRLHL